MFLLKFDNNGNMLWKKNVGQGYGYTYYPTQVSHTNDGGYIFISNEKIDQKFMPETYSSNISYINVVKLDKHGDLMWLKKIGKLNDINSFTSIKQSGEGNYINGGLAKDGRNNALIGGSLNRLGADEANITNSQIFGGINNEIAAYAGLVAPAKIAHGLIVGGSEHVIMM